MGRRIGTRDALGTDWVTAAEAAALLGVSKSRFGVVKRNLPGVRVWALPGMRPRYNKPDLLRLAEAAVTVPAESGR